MEAANCEEEDRAHRPIHLITPWISDIPLSLCRWSDDALLPIVGGLTEPRLSSVLNQLATLGHPVSVSTLSTQGSHLSLGEAHERRHQDFIDNLSGVRHAAVANLHIKMLLSCDLVLSGSANYSITGLLQS